jgi:hypothetical protein
MVLGDALVTVPMDSPGTVPPPSPPTAPGFAHVSVSWASQQTARGGTSGAIWGRAGVSVWGMRLLIREGGGPGRRG